MKAIKIRMLTTDKQVATIAANLTKRIPMLFRTEPDEFPAFSKIDVNIDLLVFVRQFFIGFFFVLERRPKIISFLFTILGTLITIL